MDAGRGRERIGAEGQTADGDCVGRDLVDQHVEQLADQLRTLGVQADLLAVDVEIRLEARRQRDLALLKRPRAQQLQEAGALRRKSRAVEQPGIHRLTLPQSIDGQRMTP